MVEAKNPNYKNLDVKLSLDLSAQGKSPIVKRVLATDYDTLMAQAKTLAGKHGISEVHLRYHDDDNWVIVEDNEDL
jgi:plastocyanin domain-containing protein